MATQIASTKFILHLLPSAVCRLRSLPHATILTMSPELVATKLIPPQPRADLVSRPRLVHRIAHPKRGRVTLVTAPAGYGKTTLLAEWCARQETRVAWVSLDAADNDPALFWRYVGAALGVPILPGETPQLKTLLNRLAQSRERVTLALDDLHVLRSAEVLNALGDFIEQLPHTVSVLIASRSRPELPLARWRARGQLNELEAAQLAFTRGETSAFLQTTMQLDATTELVTRLEIMTQGWAAALQLAALALQNADSTFPLQQARAHIFEYLAGEVLEHQSKTAQQFLLQTSVPERFTADLANALTTRTDSAKWLAKLTRAHLFITVTGADEVWYQYHPLFAEFLRGRLRAREPNQEHELHARAAQWLVRHGHYSEAIAHALRAKEYVKAGEWIEFACDAAMQHGQLATMRRWLDALPRDVVAQSPGLNIWYGWVLALQHEFEAMERHLKQAERQARRLARTERFWKTEVGMVRGKIASIRTHAAVIQREDAKTLYWTRRTLALLPERYPRERGVAWMSRARAFEHLKRFDEADDAYGQAERTTQRAAHPFLHLGVLEAHARFLLRRGETERARNGLKQAIEYARSNQVEELAVPMKMMLQEIKPQPIEKGTREPLSGREHEILDWLARGESNSQIAKRLGIGVGTVNWHTKNIYKKLGVRNRTEAAAFARNAVGAFN